MLYSFMENPQEGMVDRKGIGEFVNTLIRQFKFKREDFRTIGPMGGFTSLIDLGNIAIAMNTDGVGTKVLIAEEVSKWESIGMDCIAMNVNDTITVGAEPIAMVDYISLKKPNQEVARQLGIGLNVGAQISNISIVGGETAMLPDLVKGTDVSGTVIGIVHKNQIVTGEYIKDGDIIFGLQSSGLHSNGFTTVRKVIKDNEINLMDPFPGETKKAHEILLEPTRIYVREILDLMSIVNIKGMANITGGGLKNLVRMKDMRYVIDDPIEPQNVFNKIMELGSLDYNSMYEIFNMGIGFAIVIDQDDKRDFVSTIKNRLPFKEIGHIENGSGITVPKFGVELAGYY